MADEKRVSERREIDRRHCFLVSEWRRSYKWLSVQIPAAMTIVGLAYQGLEPFLPLLQDKANPKVMLWIFIFGAVASIVGRIKAQPSKPQ